MKKEYLSFIAIVVVIGAVFFFFREPENQEVKEDNDIEYKEKIEQLEKENLELQIELSRLEIEKDREVMEVKHSNEHSRTETYIEIFQNELIFDVFFNQESEDVQFKGHHDDDLLLLYETDSITLLMIKPEGNGPVLILPLSESTLRNEVNIAPPRTSDNGFIIGGAITDDEIEVMMLLIDSQEYEGEIMNIGKDERIWYKTLSEVPIQEEIVIEAANSSDEIIWTGIFITDWNAH
ncbi:hypothetical protein [Evansella halocellulosilytica]|uniref:hypothetical protein n=1 Tax=Evansella halocellulosilytica TaxID=2011013 RepID=UPI000BB9907B|nr:hypothetical protein [Evansella halocellulosilytica]